MRNSIILDDDLFPSFIAVVLMIIIAAVLGAVCMLIDGKHDDKLWNQGRCPECGTEWQYEQAVGHRYSTHYIYMCPKCGKRIEICEIR